MKLLNPLFHLILTLSSAALATEFHAGEQLNENNFQALTKEGLVLIELYSPFCAVCKRFAPSWIELVEKMTPYQSKGLSMAQVDCSAQGDLSSRRWELIFPDCSFTPDDDKNVESIQTYLEQKVEEYQSSSKTDHNAPRYTEPQHSEPSPETYASDEPVPQASPPPDSEDPTLQPIPDTPVDTPWSSPIRLANHTAWCKECRRLSHVWQNVALQFPTFLIYHDGTKLSYSGPKLASSMAEDILKTVATPGTHEITMREFDRAIEEKNIFFLFLHSSRTPVSIINSVQTVGKGLLGSAVILSRIIRTSTTDWAVKLLSLPPRLQGISGGAMGKDQVGGDFVKGGVQPDATASEVDGRSPPWIAVNSIPVLDELDQRNYHRILNSGTKKLVVLACISGIIPSHDGSTWTSQTRAPSN
ncbi:hypothetical protein PCASD_22652 [Puccinia coronata f. sp. avenae]|uniref:Thioredoxin domain-containing protein n=1 Tax=Puccinia coronata f. sp. avenae TaxID=200324 RepID=A0A2N5S1V6_9BASI|nr:hypothetical protein PCASD_22652 [Puccinia coronata f. sp. avenae]